MQVTFIKLKGSNFTAYYLPLIWIEWKLPILFIINNKQDWKFSSLKGALQWYKLITSYNLNTKTAFT